MDFFRDLKILRPLLRARSLTVSCICYVLAMLAFGVYCKINPQAESFLLGGIEGGFSTMFLMCVTRMAGAKRYQIMSCLPVKAGNIPKSVCFALEIRLISASILAALGFWCLGRFEFIPVFLCGMPLLLIFADFVLMTFSRNKPFSSGGFFGVLVEIAAFLFLMGIVLGLSINLAEEFNLRNLLILTGIFLAGMIVFILFRSFCIRSILREVRGIPKHKKERV